MIHMYKNNTNLDAIATRSRDCLKSVTVGIAVSNPIRNKNNIYLPNTHNRLIGFFNKYFEIVPADTSEKLLQAYRLRYEVYCKERLIPGFDPQDYPDELEYDEYDERSVHSLLMHKPSGQIAGTVRIILPDQDNIDKKFPLEKFASGSFYTEIESLKSLSRIHLGEISRLIVAPGFRKSPYSILGLFVAVAQMSNKHKLKYLYAGMDDRIATFCRTFGIYFKSISPIVDYYGPCRAYLGSIPDIAESIYWSNPETWALLTSPFKLAT